MGRVIFLAIAIIASAWTGQARSAPETYVDSPVAILDSDDDKTVDISEMGKAASDVFDNLDSDGDGKVDFRATGSRLTRQEFKKADIDKDDMLDKNEYFAAADGLLRSADEDKDGTLDEKEFSSKDGKRLQKLIR